jgi:hypothetical protein
MKIFISWSGERSKILALALKYWIENLFQNVEAFMSKSDIEPGIRWGEKLNEELEVSNFGIVCLTPENLNSQWILFESGALSKQVKIAHVIPMLFQLKPADLSGPLSQFQCLSIDENGARELSKTINNKLEKPLTAEKLEEAFLVWWDKLLLKLNDIPATSDKPLPDKRPERELIEEILEYTRNQTLKEAAINRLRNFTKDDFSAMDVDGLKKYMLDAFERMREGVSPSEIVLLKKNVAKAAQIVREKSPKNEETVNKILLNLGLPNSMLADLGVSIVSDLEKK